MLKFPIFRTTWFKQELNSYKEALEHFFCGVFCVWSSIMYSIGLSISTIQDTNTIMIKRLCCQPLLLLDISSFYWCWSSLNYLGKILITILIRFSIHIWKLNSEDQQTTAIRTANHIPRATPHQCEAMDKFHPECFCSCRMKLIIFTTFEK